MAQERESPLFGLVPSESDPNADEFWVEVAVDVTSLGARMPVSGTTQYRDFEMPHAGPPAGDYGSWLYSRRTLSQNRTGAFWFWFVRGVPGTELTGSSFEASDISPPDKFLSSKVLQLVSQDVVTGSPAPNAGGVVRSEVKAIDGVRSRLNSTILLSYEAGPVKGWDLDEDTGKGVEVIESVVPAGTPGSTEIAADGTFSTVTPVNATWSIMTTRKTTGLATTRREYVKTERSPVLWPDVMLNPQWHLVLNSSAEYFENHFSYCLKRAYTGDVKVAYTEWWQKSAPPSQTPVEMLPTGIIVPRLWSEDINIAECLHPAITVSETQILGLAGWSFATINTVWWNIPETNYKDWPEQVIKLDIEPWKGGFRCVRRVIEKPQSAVNGATVGIGGYLPSGIKTWNYHP